MIGFRKDLVEGFCHRILECGLMNSKVTSLKSVVASAPVYETGLCSYRPQPSPASLRSTLQPRQHRGWTAAKSGSRPIEIVCRSERLSTSPTFKIKSIQAASSLVCKLPNRLWSSNAKIRKTDLNFVNRLSCRWFWSTTSNRRFVCANKQLCAVSNQSEAHNNSTNRQRRFHFIELFKPGRRVLVIRQNQASAQSTITRHRGDVTIGQAFQKHQLTCPGPPLLFPVSGQRRSAEGQIGPGARQRPAGRKFWPPGARWPCRSPRASWSRPPPSRASRLILLNRLKLLLKVRFNSLPPQSYESLGPSRKYFQKTLQTIFVVFLKTRLPASSLARNASRACIQCSAFSQSRRKTWKLRHCSSNMRRVAQALRDRTQHVTRKPLGAGRD